VEDGDTEKTTPNARAAAASAPKTEGVVSVATRTSPAATVDNVVIDAERRSPIKNRWFTRFTSCVHNRFRAGIVSIYRALLLY